MLRYRLDDLGWYQFEWLCQSLLKASLGLALECWGGAHSDLGRDAYCKVDLPFPSKSSMTPGPFCFQVKFVEEANSSGADPVKLLIGAIYKEASLIRKRINSKSIVSPKCYVLLTNVDLDKDIREEVERIIGEVIPEALVVTQGANDVCSLLDDNPKVRTAFPQLLGIRDFSELLSNVVNKPVLEKSKFSRERASELAKVFVPTEAYNKTISILIEHSFVVLTGPPEMGKTAIARMIGLVKLGENWQYIEVKKPEEFSRLYDEKEKQIFLVDDAFGSTEFYAHMAREWEGDMDLVLSRVNPTHWLIWTSRSEPLKKAISKMHLQGKASKFPEPAKIIVDAKELSKREKALILYRHAKNAGLSEAGKKIIRDTAQMVVISEHFTPERIRRFIDERMEEILKSNDEKNTLKDKILKAVNDVIAEPTDRMEKSFELLDEKEQIFLVAMLDAGSHGAFKSELENSFRKFTENDSSIDWEQMADVLTTHFLRKTSRPKLEDEFKVIEAVFYDWMHPSWRDLVIDCLVKKSGLRNLFLRNCGLRGLELAFSEAGGSDGKRFWPLIVTEEDFKCASEAVERVLSDCDLSKIGNALEMFSSILDNFRQKTVDKNFLDELKLENLIKVGLANCRRRWDDGKYIFNSSDLGIFYELSEKINPLPPGPDLSETWKASCKSVLNDLEDFKDGSTFDSENANELFQLFDLIEKNEPRFLRRIRGKDQDFLNIEKYLEKIYLYYNTENITVSDRDEFLFHLRNFNEIKNFLNASKIFFPGQLSFLGELFERVDNVRDDFLFSYSSEYGDREEDENLDRTGPEDPLDLQSLFSDL